MYKKTQKTPDTNDVIKINTRSRWFNASLIGLCLAVLLGVRLQVNAPTTGDEPHYLIMDYALVHEHTFNLMSVYQNDEYLSFYPVKGLPPQGNPKLDSLNSRKIYSPHGIGLPLAVFPGFALDSKTGAVFEMVVLATLVVCLTWKWILVTTKNRLIAYVAAVLLVTCYFFNGLAGYFYPDMLIAGTTVAALIMLEIYFKKVVPQVIFGLLLGFLIFLNIKDLIIVFPLLMVLSYKLWRTERKLPWVTALITFVCIVYYLMTLHQWFGTWNPSTAYGSGVNFGNNIFNNVSAMLFDSSRGFLVYNPITLLIFVGIPIWIKKSSGTFLTAIVVVGPSIALLADFNQWNGGEAEVGRYIIDFLPVFVPAIAFSIEQLQKLWQRLAVVLLAAITLLISVDATISKFPIINAGVYFTRSTLFTQIQNHTGIAIDHLLPTFTTQTQVTILLSNHGFVKLVFSYALIVVLLAFGSFLTRKRANLKQW